MFLNNINPMKEGNSMKQVSKEEFIKLYKTQTNVQIAKDLGVDKLTVYSWAKKLGLPPKKDVLSWGRRKPLIRG